MKSFILFACIVHVLCKTVSAQPSGASSGCYLFIPDTDSSTSKCPIYVKNFTNEVGYFESSGLTIDSLTTSAQIKATQFGLSALFPQTPGPLPITSGLWTYGGGSVVLFFSGSGFTSTPDSVYTITVSLLSATGSTLVSSLSTSSFYINAGSTHVPFPTVTYNIANGGMSSAYNFTGGIQYKFQVVASSGLTTDFNDVFSLTVLQLPF